MVTIKDVAKRAGVSLGTVSNVLNGLNTVTEENRSSVMAAIKELGYRRNHAASNLRSRVSHSIGLVIPDITNPFYPEISRGVEDEARTYGYNVFLCNKDRDPKREADCINALLEKNVDGILLFKSLMSAEQLESLSRDCHVVLMDSDPGNTNCDTVSVDDYKSICAGIETLIALGHRHIAFISGHDNSLSNKARTSAYLNTMELYGLDHNKHYLRCGNYSLSSGEEHAKQLLNMEVPPTAIACANDMMALGALKAANGMGLSVPRDISIIGHDDIPFASICTPTLSTIWHPKYEMGQQSVRLIMRRLQMVADGITPTGISVVMQSQLVLRGTTAQLKPLQDTHGGVGL